MMGSHAAEGEARPMSQNPNEIILNDETDPTDVEGHYLPLDDEGNVDFSPNREPGDDVEGHVLDLDVERKR
jgi:hypothetical protein